MLALGWRQYFLPSKQIPFESLQNEQSPPTKSCFLSGILLFKVFELRVILSSTRLTGSKPEPPPIPTTSIQTCLAIPVLVHVLVER